MTIYNRFYIKTARPQWVERLMLATLNDDRLLEWNDQGLLLRPLTVVNEEARHIQPARDFCLNLICTEAEPEPPSMSVWGAITRLWKGEPATQSPDAPEASEPKWYWVKTRLRFHSIEAAHLAQALHESPFVAVLAEDNEISGAMADSLATIIGADHYMIKQAQANYSAIVSQR